MNKEVVQHPDWHRLDEPQANQVYGHPMSGIKYHAKFLEEVAFEQSLEKRVRIPQASESRCRTLVSDHFEVLGIIFCTTVPLTLPNSGSVPKMLMRLL